MFNIVVIGSGTMGAGIAEQVANSGHKIHLLDIIPNNAEDRNILAKQAIEKLAPSLEERAQLIISGNIEDNLEDIKSADWIIEVVIEKLDIKQTLYKKLEQYCKPDAIISSNTSTIPLKSLIDGMSDNFKQHFLITHFFNPPRYMPLLELVTSNFTKQDVIDKISNFLDIHLGKTIVKSNDTPGFIANRIGCYWLETGLKYAIEMGVSIEEVDSIMGKPLAIPSTAIFGLYDLIGIDVMRLIVKSLSTRLHCDDDFLKISKEWPLVSKMIEDGLIGRKGKGGFYRITKDKAGNKIKEVIDLQTGEYKTISNITSPAMDIKTLMEHSQYALLVLSKTLSYAANLIPEVSGNLSDIDQAMRLGYNWKYGPFELIDLIGPDYFRKKLEEQNIEIPMIIAKVGNNKFYSQDKYFTGSGYAKIPRAEGVIFLTDFDKIIYENNSAKIRDIGEGIAAIEITSKMAILNHEVFDLIIQFFTNHSAKYKGLVIANQQSNFSAGGNLKFMLEMAEAKKFQEIDDYLNLGQKAMLKLKYSSIPVVSALKGMALGGGYELLLHSSAVISHIEANIGLVETGVGIIPGWGGCTELIIKSKSLDEKITAFKNILLGIISPAHKFPFKLVMNIERVLQQSKNLCLELSRNYTPPIKQKIKNIDVNWDKEIIDLNLTGYNQIIAKELLSIFSLKDADEAQLLKQERIVFLRLLKNQPTIDRIKYMLENGKRLMN